MSPADGSMAYRRSSASCLTQRPEYADGGANAKAACGGQCSGDSRWLDTDLLDDPLGR